MFVKENNYDATNIIVAVCSLYLAYTILKLIKKYIIDPVNEEIRLNKSAYVKRINFVEEVDLDSSSFVFTNGIQEVKKVKNKRKKYLVLFHGEFMYRTSHHEEYKDLEEKGYLMTRKLDIDTYKHWINLKGITFSDGRYFKISGEASNDYETCSYYITSSKILLSSPTVVASYYRMVREYEKLN